MRSETLTQRVLAHIRKYEHEIDETWAPKELTQPGMAEALGKSRAHIATITRQLEMRGAVMTQMRHVNGLPTRYRYRKIYRTTNKNGVCLSGKYIQVPVLKMAEVQHHVKALEQLLRCVDVKEDD